MQTTTLTCSRCGAIIPNPNAQNCNRCGIPLLAILPKSTLVGGQYRVVQPLKEGGSAQVYLVEDTRTFDRQCILKRTLLNSDPEARQQFAREAHMLTKLRHPQIPQVFAYFEEQDSANIVMEYITGDDLETGLSSIASNGSVVSGKAHDLKQTIQDGIVVCKLLEYLHSRNPAIVHCDIKPANLIRDRESNALFLVDFGAAAANGVFGTPGYAAPEQYQQQRSPVSDIYALAATLYHLLTDDDPTEHPRKFPKLASLPKQIANLLQWSLAEKASQRPDATQLKKWLTECLELPQVNPFALVFPSGGQPTTLIELAREMSNDWNAAHSLINNGKIAQWLKHYKYENLADWLENMIILHGADGVVHLFLQRVIPSFPVPKVAFEPNYLVLPMDDQVVTPLKVAIIGGSAQVKVQDVPEWLQVSPLQMKLYPGHAEKLQVRVRLNLIPRFFMSTIITMSVTYPGFESYHVKIPVSLQKTNKPVMLPASAVKSLNLQWLVAGWTLIALALIGWIMLNPSEVVLPVTLGLGGLIGVTSSWLYSESITDTLMLVGGSIFAALMGRLFYSISTSELNPEQINSGILFFVIIPALAIVGMYRYFKTT